MDDFYTKPSGEKVFSSLLERTAGDGWAAAKEIQGDEEHLGLGRLWLYVLVVMPYTLFTYCERVESFDLIVIAIFHEENLHIMSYTRRPFHDVLAASPHMSGD